MPNPTTITTTTNTQPATSSIPTAITIPTTEAKPVAAAQTGIPEFHGNSYIELPLKKRVGKSLEYEIWLLANEPDGVILYASQTGTAKGDFLSLNLIDGFLQFRFDLGSGAANIISASKLPLNTWNKVVVSRTDHTGSLRVNDDTAVVGTSKGASKELNLQLKLYVGGFPGEYSPDAGINTGFTGAIQRIYETGTLIENLTSTALQVVNVTDYSGPPCQTLDGKNSCPNGGTCTPWLNDYHCLLPTSSSDCDNCASPSTATVNPDAALHFSGTTYHSYYNGVAVKQPSQKKNRYELKFHTTSDSGVLLIQNKGESVRLDYFVIAVVNGGYVEAGFNLGKQSTTNLFTIRSMVTINDGQWHTVVLDREGTDVTLSVDEVDYVKGSSAAGASDLNTDGVLWIGGKSELPSGLPYSGGFQGCISSVLIDGKQLHLVNDRKNLEPEPEFCTISPSV